MRNMKRFCRYGFIDGFTADFTIPAKRISLGEELVSFRLSIYSSTLHSFIRISDLLLKNRKNYCREEECC